MKRKKNSTKRTVQFRVKDVTFFRKGSDGRLRQIPRNAPEEEIMMADAVTLKLENQKNGWKGVCISHHSNGEGMYDPVRAVGRRFVHIRRNSRDTNCFLSAVFVDGVRTDVCDKDISAALKVAAAALDYPNSRGIPIDCIDTHSLRIGGANALSLAGYSDRFSRYCQVPGLPLEQYAGRHALPRSRAIRHWRRLSGRVAYAQVDPVIPALKGRSNAR